MKINICIDIDGTITEPYYWIEKANEYFNKKIEPKEVIEYDIHRVLNVDREEYLKFYQTFGYELHLNAEIRKNASEIINKIKSFSNVHYVTARESKMEKITIDWLKLNNLCDENLHLLGSHYKVNKAKELNCDIFIEDRYKNALELSLAGFKVLLIDTYYNRNPLLKNITRVYDWNEIYKYILRYSKEKEILIKTIA